MCEHNEFQGSIRVARLQASDDDPTIVGHHADITINCSQCGAFFEFVGVPVGYSKQRPSVNVDRTELRAPIKESTSRRPNLKVVTAHQN